MLSIQDISIAYDDKIVVDKFSVAIASGEIVSIVGESGSGKTSILRSILGLLPAAATISGGEILYNDTSLLNIPAIQMNKIRGAEISMMFQDSSLSLNPIRKIGHQFIQYILAHKNISKSEAQLLATATLSKMNLDGPAIMKSYMFNLSGGMKQRVGMAFAMALSPKLLLLDEPTSALDAATQDQVIAEIMALHSESNTAILMITHNILVATRMSNNIIVLKDGKIMSPESCYSKKLLGGI